ncbi:beta-mannosidase [Drosophila willistoni]|uniref:beta-mannosidase n=1 Tax=Drosophila willistoni TaxID=7260 RepID=UPI000C26D8AB|nr:beta-mannosidase [Drosophila willistoni]
MFTDYDFSLQIDVSKIPSGVYTELKGLYGDVLIGRNDVNLRWIANETWIYKTTFDSYELGDDSLVNLTLHGIDTLSKVYLNDELLGETNNMFVRYSFAVGHLLRPSPGQNTLEIVILSPLKEAKARAEELDGVLPISCPRSRGDVECHRNMLRKMQMSFGGEWNPTALSSGIWKPVAIEYYTVAILRDVDVAINRNETHWIMDCRAFLSTPSTENFYVNLLVFVSELLDEPFKLIQQKVHYASPIIEFKIPIPQDRVTLWWPNGYGQQKLYPVLFRLNSFSSEDGPVLSSRTESQKLLKIGFRTIELVEDEDTIGRTFFFRVNDHPIFIKGANYVPANTLPELSTTEDTVKHLLKSAREVNMNMIRVWAGGLYESDIFYNLADEYGLLVWQDMAFNAAAYPVTDEFVASASMEAAQNAQRLAHHPSLSLIVLNNEIELFLVKNRSEFGANATRLENEYKILFMGTLKHELSIISRNDFNPRPGPMISTPSLGITESAKELAKDPQSTNYGDVHFWDDEKDGYGADIYPRARFISEVGYASLPMLHTWQRALGTNVSWSNENIASLIRSRQHDPKGFIPLLRLIAYQLPFYLQTWDENIDEFIYFSQLAQAMTSKTAVELFRSLRTGNQTMGALIWQLNDVWVGPTWSCIDFYGNYKMVYYWAKDFLAPTSVITLYDEANDQLNVTLTREDYAEHLDIQLFNVTFKTYTWTDIFFKKEIGRASGLGSNGIDHLNIPMESVLDKSYTKAEVFFEIVVEDSDNELIARNYFYPVAIKNIKGMMDPELAIEVVGIDCSTARSPYRNNFTLRITVKYPALFVYLEFSHPDYVDERHKFSTNGFTQTVPRQSVHLEFENDKVCLTITEANIRVYTMNQYMI